MLIVIGGNAKVDDFLSLPGEEVLNYKASGAAVGSGRGAEHLGTSVLRQNC